MTSGHGDPSSARRAAHIIDSASDGADREVDARRDDDDELAQRQQLVEGRLAEDVEDVALGQEDVRLGQPGQDAP